MQCPTCGIQVLSADGACEHCGEFFARPKGGAEPKIPYLAQVSTRQLLRAGVVALLVLIALLLAMLPRGGKREKRAMLKRPGEEINIEAKMVPKFTAGKALKDAVN